MAPKKNRKNIRREVPVPVDCIFCKTKTEPDYKNYEDLFNFLSDRAKIIGKKRSGICSKHQRRLANEIKRARHLGLLPFTPTI
jgi:small subunit ribosomal protein S18